MSTKSKGNNTSNLKRKVWIIFIIFLIFIPIFFWGVSHGLLGHMPSFDEIENPNSKLASEVYSEDSDIPIGKYYRENRSNAVYAELPQNLVDALIATEDVRFYEHSGIDLKRTLSAVLFLGKRGGGSTITQQLAKNLFHNKPRSYIGRIFQKIKEYVISVQLEHTYTKEEILTMYLNTVDFVHNSFGIKTAAKTYFNKSVSDLTLNESACLIGMLRGSSFYNPKSNPENANNRKKTVIDQMLKYGKISQAVHDSVRPIPIVVEFSEASHINGIAPHFREQLRMWLTEWAKTHINPSTGEPYDIYDDGLKIYTTINQKMQQYAEEAVHEHLSEWQTQMFNTWKTKDPWEYYDKYDRASSAPKQNDLLIENVTKIFMQKDTLSKEKALKVIQTPRAMQVWSYKGMIDTVLSPLDSIKYYKKMLQVGFLAVDPHTGYVKAWVGGSNFEYNQFDHVNKNTKRQVGSTFKPFIYVLAVKEKGYSPCFRVPDLPYCFSPGDPRWPIYKTYCPKNSDGGSSGMMAIKDGLARSKNQVTAFLMGQLSAKLVVDFAHKMGIESEIPPYPSICLGVADISVYEMIRAYSTFANFGKTNEPIFVARIEDSHGNVIEEFYPENTSSLDEESAYVITQMLRNVVDGPPSLVTGARVRFRYNIPKTLEIAAKTGTTQNNSDGWFIGYTPELLAGAWVGCDDKFVRFRSTGLGQGASTALPIWAKFINKVYADTSLHYDINAKFQAPVKELSVQLDCSKFVQDEGEKLDGDIYE